MLREESQSTMSVHVIPGVQQRLGRRLGLHPYYTLVDHGPGRLELVSSAEANRTPGLRLIAVGVVIIAIALLIAISGLLNLTGGAGFAVGGFAAVIGGLLGGLGYQRIVGGYAILTTHNRISYDEATGLLTWSQASAIGVERQQQLSREQLTALRVRRRPLAVGWPIRRTQPIVALELLVGNQVWVIDTAAQTDALLPVAEAVSVALDVAFATE